MTLEETFAKIGGRHASDEERQRLYRLRDALGLRDNDAFWSIVMALEYYDSFFRRYPAELAQCTERCIEDARAAFAAAAEREVARVQRTLSEKVAETSVAIARRLAERPVGLHRVTMLLAAVVAFGALCVSAGYSLAAPVKPFWATRVETVAPLQREAAEVLAAPAGWMIFALLLPAAVYGARVGWGTASEATQRHDRIVGWGIVATCCDGSFGCLRPSCRGAIVMVRSSKYGDGRDGAGKRGSGTLERNGGPLPDPLGRTSLVEVAHRVFGEDLPKMFLAHDDHMIEALASDASQATLTHRRPPQRSRRSTSRRTSSARSQRMATSSRRE